MGMKTYRTATISILLCLNLLVFAGLGLSAEREKVKADPANNATWSGEGGKDNFIGTCSPCHGESGKGDGPLSDTLGEGIKPRNLTDDELLSTRTDDELFNVIKNGGDSIGLSEAMPSQKDTFSDEEIRQIVAYIRHDLCKCQYKAE